MTESVTKYWDITYITPVGIQGIHYAVEGETVEEAMEKTPIMLSYGTPWRPDEFQAVSGIPCANPPIPPAPQEPVEESDSETE